ncbi:hypothetical protein [Stenotrophomonas maltophilia]|uniref:hypothetical protein n=1 Tax=Stenotrophomonas maltophilia TaxID=40324 RepID=UPI0007F8D406|nr:hypothetical protein [Stenotrophomonas maltophilia]OBU59200.1 hypothetical protein A9K70_01370 [Stenotrophomonas maltophilia]
MNLEQIDTSTTAGKAEVMRLAAEGRRVAARRKIRLTDEWWEPGEANWNWSDIEFAIISEPVGPEEVWLAIYNDGSISRVGTRDEVYSRVLDGRAAGLDSVAVRYIRADLAGEKG